MLYIYVTSLAPRDGLTHCVSRPLFLVPSRPRAGSHSMFVAIYISIYIYVYIHTYRCY